MPITTTTLSKYLNPVFVETGSYIGDGIQTAINAGFPSIRSLELSEKYLDISINRFISYPTTRVKIYQGDSAYNLYEIIKDIRCQITFWLDGHHSCGDTALGSFWSPLMQELEQIHQHTNETNITHTILIDDVRCWLVKQGPIQFDIEDVKNKLFEINPTYVLSYEDGIIPNDILVAHL